MSHINFGDTGLIVQYIQNFLKDNYNKNIHLSDEYDKETHKALIDYLKFLYAYQSVSVCLILFKCSRSISFCFLNSKYLLHDE